MGEMDDLFGEFIVECTENLDLLDRDLVTLEQQPGDQDLLQAIFRYVHTIKGNSGCLGFAKLESVTHAGENLLSLMRDGELVLNGDIATALLQMLDAVREIIESLEASGVEGDTDYSGLMQELVRLKDPGASAPPDRAEASAETAALPPELDDLDQEFIRECRTQLEALRAGLAALGEGGDVAALTEPIDVMAVISGPLGKDKTEALAQAAKAFCDRLRQAPLPNLPGTVKVLEDFAAAVSDGLEVLESTGRECAASHDALLARLAMAPGDLEAETPEELPSDRKGPPAPTEGKKAAPTPVARQEHASSSGTIRISVDLLDGLMNLAGELVLTRNQILHTPAATHDPSLSKATQRLDFITTSMQEEVMRMRMQPVSVVWGKFPRVVRDVARSCEKKVGLVMEGTETELDKTLLEAIKDPMTHIIRNSIDHGIELPADRLAQGKPEEGTIVLRAYHGGGKVNIECRDDGAGINTQRIKEKALERGVITPEQAANMDEGALTQLIFHPGFSMAKAVTNISGRGVGMDVVRSSIERVGGSVDIESTLGRGTTLRINLPLTLAIVPALLVRGGGARYAIPQAAVLELVRMEADEANERIETVQDTRLCHLRGQLLPVVDLQCQLSQDNGRFPEDERAADRPVYVVVLESDDRRFGLTVDRILDTQEIVVKPLGPQLEHIPVYSGATILGDGDVAMILDPQGLARRGGVRSERTEAALATAAVDTDTTGEETESLVVVRTRDDGRAIIPLEHVERLDRLPRQKTERVAGQQVVQHAGQIMPLIFLDDALPERREQCRSGEAPAAGENGRDLRVVIIATESGPVGLVVHQVCDIVEEAITARGRPSRKGVLGTVVVQGRVSELLDVDGLVRDHVFA